MTRLSDNELVLWHAELIRRRNLPADDSKHLSSEYVRAFFEDKLILHEELDEGKVILLRPYVEKLISAGYHKYTVTVDGTVGMKAKEYRRLWPKYVAQPSEYADRFDHILLVDRTIETDQLAMCGPGCVLVEVKGELDELKYPQDKICEHRLKDIVEPPLGEHGDPLKRYVAFWQYRRNLDQSVKDCCASMAVDEVGLVTVEGLHLPVQCNNEEIRWHEVDLPGSRGRGDFGAVSASSTPCVLGLGQGPFRLFDFPTESNYPTRGSATRGIKVIPVT